MLFGLVDDLNAHTRFTGLPLRAGRQCGRRAAGVRLDDRLSDAHRLRPRLSGARSLALRRDAAGRERRGRLRAVDLGLSATRAPAWTRDVPTIALDRGRTPVARPRAFTSQVGRPGIDHDAVEHLAATGTLGARAGDQAERRCSRSPRSSRGSPRRCRSRTRHADAHRRRPRHRSGQRPRRRSAMSGCATAASSRRRAGGARRRNP